MNNALPHLTLLNAEQIQQVDRFVVRILTGTGVRVGSDAVIKLLKKTGQVQIDGQVVRFSPEIISQSIGSAPPVIQMFDRRGNPAFRLGDDRLRFGVGVTALYYQEPVADNLEPFTRAHMRILTRLAGSLPRYDCISTLGIVRDVPEALGDLYGNLEMFANTTKPLVVLTSDEENFSPLMELFEALHGGLGVKPFILPYFNPVSPLVMDSGTLLKMQAAVSRDLPFIFSNYSMIGATTPFTPAGSLALLMAELLAGLTISQVMKPGTPIALGMLPAYFDMKTMVNFYDPQSILLNLACAEIMAHYNLPHCGSSGSGTGWGMDLVAADSYWMNTLTFALTKGGLAPFIGDSLGAKSISPLTIVHAHEIIDQALRFANGFQLDEAQAVLDEIARIGPGGSFLSAPSTYKNFKTGYYTHPVYTRWSMEKWQAQGQPAAHQVLREKTQSMLRELSGPQDCGELIAVGHERIQSIRNGS